MTLHPLVQFFLEATYHRPPGIWTIWLYLGSGRRSVYLWKLLLVVVGHILICLPAHWPKHIHGYMRKWKFLQKMQPEFNDLKHVDPTDQVQPIVPTRSHHGREQLVHQLLYNIYIIYHLYHITSSYYIRIISYISYIHKWFCLGFDFTLWVVSREAPLRFRLAQSPATWLTIWLSYCLLTRALNTASSKTSRSSCLSSGSRPPDIFNGLGLSTLVCLPTPPRPPLPKLPTRTKSDMPTTWVLDWPDFYLSFQLSVCLRDTQTCREKLCQSVWCGSDPFTAVGFGGRPKDNSSTSKKHLIVFGQSYLKTMKASLSTIYHTLWQKSYNLKTGLYSFARQCHNFNQ